VKSLVVVMALLTPVLASRPARAFQIESPVTASCHEELTTRAVTAAGFPDIARAPRGTEDQRRAMNDLTFSLTSRDIWTMALLFGVRSNDIRDFAPKDTSALSGVHNDPLDQPAHCMRRPEDDGPGGDASALAACRAFIVGELETGGLLEEALDLAPNEEVRVFLAFRGRTSIELPSFAYRLGRALHAVQDGYTHVFRAPDESAAVTHVLNWVDFVDDDYDTERDGYHHIAALDDCRRKDALEDRRRARAESASISLLEAIANPAPGRRARVEAALDAMFAHLPGCEHANDYCNAHELGEEASYGCAVAGGSVVLVLFVLGFVVVRRRAAIALVVVLAPASARADLRWHFDARGGASLDETALAASVGIGADYKRWTGGFNIEWNPWISIDAERIVAGSFNAYATLSRRWYVAPEVSIYSRAELGTSTLLFELVGIDRYTTGVYYGGVLVGLRIPISRCVDFTFDPSHLSMPTPSLFSGFPFYYGQWRLTLGIEARL
jgi:hypothetical protein